MSLTLQAEQWVNCEKSNSKGNYVTQMSSQTSHIEKHLLFNLELMYGLQRVDKSHEITDNVLCRCAFSNYFIDSSEFPNIP